MATLAYEHTELNDLVGHYGLLRRHMMEALQQSELEVACNGIISWPTIHRMNGARAAFKEVADKYEALKLSDFPT